MKNGFRAFFGPGGGEISDGNGCEPGEKNYPLSVDILRNY